MEPNDLKEELNEGEEKVWLGKLDLTQASKDL